MERKKELCVLLLLCKSILLRMKLFLARFGVLLFFSPILAVPGMCCICECFDSVILGFVEKEIRKANIPIMDTGENPEVPFPRDMIDLEVNNSEEVRCFFFEWVESRINSCCPVSIVC